VNRARLLAATVLAALYLWSLAPSVHVHDAGELTSAAWTLGLGHPPGSPLYMLLAKAFFLLLPLGSIAWRGNLFSAAAAVGAFFCFDAVARRLTGRPSLALAGACAFALSATFWSQAEMAEVYTLQALLLLLFLGSAARAWDGDGSSQTAAFCWGLLLACHVGLAPLTPLALLWLPGAEGRGGWARIRGATRLLPAFLLPLLLYTYAPLRALADPAVDWGNPQSPRAIWWYLTNRAVRGRMFSLAPGEYLGRAWEYLGILASGLHILLPFALLGLAVGWRRRRPLALLLASVAAADAAFVVLMDTAPLASEAYAIPSVAALALLAVWGLSRLERPAFARAAVASAWGAAVLSLGLNLGPNDLHQNFLVRDAGESLLAQVPSQKAATLLVQEDSTTNALAYLCFVEGARPDLEVFDRLGNLFGSLYDRPLFTVEAAERPAYRRSREEPAILSRLGQDRPVFFSTSHLDYAPERFRLAPGDFASRACLPDGPCGAPDGSRFPPPRAGDHPDWMSRQVLAELATRRAEASLAAGRGEEAREALVESIARADLPELLLLSGQLARRAGDRELALRAAGEALARRPGFAPALYLRGSILMEDGREGDARSALQAAAAADPSLPQPEALLGQMAARHGDWGSAREAFGRSLALEPRQPDILHDRALSSLALGDAPSAEADLRAALALEPGHRPSRLRLVRLLAESGRRAEAAQVLCGACAVDTASAWPAPALRDLLLYAARLGFPPCVDPWLSRWKPTGEEGRGLAASYADAEAQVRRSQQR